MKYICFVVYAALICFYFGERVYRSSHNIKYVRCVAARFSVISTIYSYLFIWFCDIEKKKYLDWRLEIGTRWLLGDLLDYTGIYFFLFLLLLFHKYKNGTYETNLKIVLGIFFSYISLFYKYCTNAVLYFGINYTLNSLMYRMEQSYLFSFLCDWQF